MSLRTVVIALLVYMAGTLASHADDLTLAVDGKSDYQIIVPDSSPGEAIATRLVQVARLVQNVFKANGCSVPVVAEKDRNQAKPGMYLGNTAFARANGVDVSTLEGWSYIHKVVGKNVIITGRDEPSPVEKTEGRRTPRDRLGTLKGVADFLRRYAGTRFLYPARGPDDEISIEFAKVEHITVPSDLDMVKKSMLLVNYTFRQEEGIYHIANNHFPRVDLYGSAHTFGDAIPIEKYRDTHPEYFNLRDGKRVLDARPNVVHYCISNPEVQELLYQYMLKMFDSGYEMVVLGPMDSYKACQCEKCKALYNTGDDWCEKLWLLNRDICNRLYKVRPDKKVLVLAYTVTEPPPKTFTRFPDNMMVQICGTNERDWEAWKDIEVPAGYVAYLYNWGVYHQGGAYTPKRTPKHLELQAKRLAEHNVKGICKGGCSDLYGLEGPAYYTFGLMYDDPENNSSEALVDEFCTAAFGAAKEPAMRFYERLNKGIEYYSDDIGIRCLDWNTFTRDSFELIRVLYKPELMSALEADLSEAEKAADSERVKQRLQLVRWEFNYLKSLVTVVNLYYEHKERPDDKALLAKLLDAIDARTAEVNLICDRDLRAEIDRDGGWSSTMFPPPGHRAEHLQLRDNRYRSQFKDTAVNWDTATMRKQNGIPEPVIKTGGSDDNIPDFENKN